MSSSLPPKPAPAAAASSRAPRDPRVLHRGALARIELIHARLRAVTPDSIAKVTAASLAKELGRSRNTVLNDLEAMKASFAAPIEWDPQRGSYFYSRRPFELRPRVSLDAIDTLALVAASRTQSASRAFPLGAELVRAIEKITPVLGDAVSLQSHALDAILSAPEDQASELDGRHFALLFDAIVHRREVRMIYHAPARDAVPPPRAIHPLHLLILADGCILIAHDTSCHKVLNFALERIRNLDLTGAAFAPPKSFDLKKYLAGRVGRFVGEPRHEVRVRFAAAYVPYVRVRPWQHPQLLVELPGGSAEATYRVAHTRELEQRILAAAGQAEVISPPEVRARLQAAATALARQHGD